MIAPEKQNCVHPANMRRGIGRSLIEYVLSVFSKIQYIEVLQGNKPAISLYESFGFKVTGVEKGKMPGNEDFAVEVCILKR